MRLRPLSGLAGTLNPEKLSWLRAYPSLFEF